MAMTRIKGLRKNWNTKQKNWGIKNCKTSKPKQTRLNVDEWTKMAVDEEFRPNVLIFAVLIR